jgi:hypothetical protein
MTGRDLVTATLKLIGAVAPGETPAYEELNDGLLTLNRMIGSWSNESLLIHAKVREELTLTASDGEYTFGIGGNINTARPMKIEEALIEDVTNTPTAEYPLKILTLAEWCAITQKDLESDIPTSLYVDNAYPLTTLSLYPVPSAANKLVLFSWKPITELTTLNTAISLPPGYEEALIYNLAIRLSPEYGRPVSQEIAMIAGDSKASIKRMNHKPSYLRVDPALMTKGSFNIYTGGA